MKLIFLMLGDS